MEGREPETTQPYRYGFGGQEKDDEVSGIGNSYTAEFWQYDPRLGRRWNIDPIVKAWESPYATFSNNPIYYKDPNGDAAEGGDDKKKPQGTTEPTTGNKETRYPDGTFTGQPADPTTLDEVVIKPSPEVKAPTPAPAEILGTVEYYKFRNDDFIKRHPNSSPPEYYINYGDKYARRFSNELNPKLTPEGQEWLMKARLYLQLEMEKELNKNPRIELNNQDFQKFAFDSHVKAYTDAGVLELGFGDKVLILSTPDAKDLLSDLGRQQAMQMGILQIQFYMNNPEVLMQHIEKIPEDASRVGAGAINEMLKKTIIP
jgi:RHS repeat-associated protein